MTQEVDWSAAKQAALHLANLVAPDGKVQKGFSFLVKEMGELQMSDKDITRAVVGRVLDGLYYGNWPKEGTNG